APVIPYSLMMLSVWWMYLYSYVVLPWQYMQPNGSRYGPSFNLLYTAADLTFTIVLAFLSWNSEGSWRKLYRRLLVGSVGYTISAQVINAAIDERRYYTGSIFDLPLVFAIVCICWAAASAQTDDGSAETQEEAG